MSTPSRAVDPVKFTAKVRLVDLNPLLRQMYRALREAGVARSQANHLIFEIVRDNPGNGTIAIAMAP